MQNAFTSTRRQHSRVVVRCCVPNRSPGVSESSLVCIHLPESLPPCGWDDLTDPTPQAQGGRAFQNRLPAAGSAGYVPLHLGRPAPSGFAKATPV